MRKEFFEGIKKLFLDIFFPKFCLGCEKEGEYLCQDCKELLDILTIHRPFKTKYLSDLYFPLVYKRPLVKKLILNFKYPPLIRDLAETLAILILDHLKLIGKEKDFKDFVLIPVPLGKKRLKWRGFNQAEEIGKILAKNLKIEILSNVLLKGRETLPQVELSERERKENVKGCFFVKNGVIKNKKILLLDDVYTTGETMEEAAKTLKKAGAKEIIGMVVAKAEPGEDKIE